MDEITKPTAVRAFEKFFTGGRNYIKENFIRAYKSDKLYLMILKHPTKDIVVLMCGEYGKGNYQKIAYSLETFRAIQNLNINAVETLFKGKTNGNEKNL